MNETVSRIVLQVIEMIPHSTILLAFGSAIFVMWPIARHSFIAMAPDKATQTCDLRVYSLLTLGLISSLTASLAHDVGWTFFWLIALFIAYYCVLFPFAIIVTDMFRQRKNHKISHQEDWLR